MKLHPYILARVRALIKEDIMKKKTSITLSAKDKRLLELLVKKEARSQTAEIEYLIRRRSEELDIKIEEP